MPNKAEMPNSAGIAESPSILAQQIAGHAQQIAEDMPLETSEHEARPYDSGWFHCKASVRVTGEAQSAPRCEYCDGTGDVHNQVGEWLGTCQPCADANLLDALTATAKDCPGFESIPAKTGDLTHFSTAYLTQQQDELFSLLSPANVLRLVAMVAANADDAQRYRFGLTHDAIDADGYEIGMARVKWKADGTIDHVLWCSTDGREIDAAMAAKGGAQ